MPLTIRLSRRLCVALLPTLKDESGVASRIKSRISALGYSCDNRDSVSFKFEEHAPPIGERTRMWSKRSAHELLAVINKTLANNKRLTKPTYAALVARSSQLERYLGIDVVKKLAGLGNDTVKFVTA